jgi:hypothetical protein
MTYTVLPNSGQSLGVTRIPINTNFSLIQSVFDKNHYDFNVTNAGKHMFLQMPVQGVTPTTLINEGAFYSATAKGDAQAFWRFQSDGTSLQITNNTINLVATPGAVPMMGGMTMQWGSGTYGNGVTVPFFATFTSVVNIQVVIADATADGTANAVVKGFTQSGFTFATNAGAPIGIFWLAIGFI